MGIDERFRNILRDNDMDQTAASTVTGINGSSLSRFLNKKNEKAYEFEAIFKICKTDEQRFYLATGKHLSSHTPDRTVESELLGIIKGLKKSLNLLTTEVGELRQELKQMREEKCRGEVRLPMKIPDT